MPEPAEKLFEEVLSDALARADTARRRGQQEAGDVQERVAQEARQAADGIVAAAGREAETRKSQTIAMAAVELERQRLSAVEAALRTVLDRARQSLAAVNGERAQRARVELALEALAQLPPGEAAEIALPEGTDAGQLVPEIARLAAERLHRAVELRPASGPSGSAVGVVVRTADGRIEIVNSPQERLRRLWPDLRLELAAKLFPEVVQDKEK